MNEADDHTARFWLKVGDSEIPLTDSWMTVGRAEDCDIVLDDTFVSRQHARFAATDAGVMIEDLSTNGVFADGERIEQRRILDHGAIVTIGGFEIQIVIDAGQRRTAPPTEPPPSDISTRPPTVRPNPPAGAMASLRETTTRADAIALLIPVAHRLLDEDRVDGAERLMSARLHAILDDAKRSGRLSSSHAISAAKLAIRFAEATSRASWLEYAFEVCAINPDLLARDVVDRLYSVVRKVPSLRTSALRRYLDALDQISNRLGPSDRFVLQRLRGLAKLSESL